MRKLQHRQRPSEWNSLAAVREATAGALAALVVMACFVLFGLGWAVLADASQSHSQSPAQSPRLQLPRLSAAPPPGSHASRLASDSLTRYRKQPHNSPPIHRAEVHHAHFEPNTNRQSPHHGYRR